MGMVLANGRLSNGRLVRMSRRGYDLSAHCSMALSISPKTTSPKMYRSLEIGFNTRRSAIWFANRRWIIASLVSLLLLVMLGRLDNAPRDPLLVLAVATAVTVFFTLGRIVRALDALYRCPGCGTQPYQALNDYKCGGLGPSRSDFMSPTHCPNCGTRIR
jgi:hypothetical protein